MRYKSFYFTILFCLTISTLQGQNNSSLGSYTSWKPFTFELNSSSIGHGISVEKKIINKTSLRMGFASEFNSLEFIDSAYKLNVGVICDFVEIGPFSLRTGLDLGIRKIHIQSISPNPNSLIDVIIETIPGPNTISAGFIDIPFLLNYTLNNNFSLDVGIRNIFQLQIDNPINPTAIRPAIQPYYHIEKRIHGYHVGLRYTFTD